MIYSKLILNTRGMIVYEDPRFELIEYNSYEFDEFRLFLYSLDVGKSNTEIHIPENFKVDSKVKFIYENDENGRYIVFYDTKDNFSNEFTKMKNFRKEQLQKFRGILFVDFDDSFGPDVRYNSDPENVDDETAMRIGLQCFTTLGIGSGGSFTSGFHGPLILSDINVSILIYAFIRPAPDSKDSRIARTGRPSTIILMYRNAMDADNKLVKNFVETSLQRNYLSEKQKLTTNELKQVLNELKETSLFALDLSEVERVHNLRLKETVNRLQREVDYLKEKVKELEEENTELKKNIKT